MKAKITYRGWAGHFICAHQCRFRLNTLIEVGERRVVVSTVGAMEDPTVKDRTAFREIGLNRDFETMAFEARFDGTFWDADVTKEVEFSPPWCFQGVTNENELLANNNHERIVTEIASRLEQEAA